MRPLFVLALWVLTATPVMAYDPLAHWTFRASPSVTNDLWGITFARDKFVAVGQNCLLHSIDGSQWHSGILEGGEIGFRYAVAAGPNGFIALPGHGSSTIASSENGSNWVAHSAPTNNFDQPGVAYGNGRYVVVDNNKPVFTSSNGVDWTAHSITNPPRKVFFLNGEFWGCGNSEILRSTNGIIWTRKYFTNIYITSMTYGNGIYVALGFDPPIPDGSAGGAGYFPVFTSTNGDDWLLSAVIYRGRPWSVTYGAGHFVAVGTYDTLLTSRDGINWTYRNLSNWYYTPLHLVHVCYGNGTFVAVGDCRLIVQSDPIVGLELSDSPARLMISGPSSRVCQIEYTENVFSTNTWIPFTTVTLTNAPVAVDLDSLGLGRRFYRAVLP